MENFQKQLIIIILLKSNKYIFRYNIYKTSHMFGQGFSCKQQNRCDVFKDHEEWESQEETQGAAALRHKWDEIIDQVLLLFLNLVIGKQDFISLKEVQ